MPTRPWQRLLSVSLALGVGSAAPASVAAPARRPPAADAPPPLLGGTPRPAEPPPGVSDAELLPGAQVLPLDALLQHARDNAITVKVAQARLSLGDAAVKGARPLLPENPQLYVGAGARVNRNGVRFELQSTLTQPIEIARERGLRLRAGRSYRAYLDKELAQVRWDNAARVHYAFNMALVAKERARTAARTLAFAERLLQIAEARAKAGEISRLRVRVAEGERAQARQAKLAADVRYRIACVHLGEIAGWPQGQLVAPAGSLPQPVRVRSAEELVAQLQKDHPALKAREAMLDLGEARVRSANRDAFPEPQIGVYFGRESEPGTNIDSRLALLMLTLPLPIWKRNQAARAQAKAELSVAESELDAARYTLALGARRVVDAVNTAGDRVRTYSQEVTPRFQENLDLLQRAFELGEVDILEVFVARARFVRIQEDALAAYETYFEAVFVLETTIGAPITAAAAR